jgi:23S rRNA (cytosine1962-C5)-methyltransferase
LSLRALALPPQAAIAVQSGIRDVPLSLLPQGRGLAAGEPLQLQLPGGRDLGTAVADPENERLRVFAGPGEAPDGLGPAFFSSRVERALELRRGLGLLGPDQACRVVHGAGDGLPGLTADVFGAFAVVNAYARALAPLGHALGEALLAQARLRGVVIKLRSRGAASQGPVKQELIGEEPPPRLVVQECSVPFEVHLATGLNVGLFLDMREHRHALASLCAGRRVLNGFAYTGTLSVLAARGGAREVTSVDLSAGTLAWARDNFELSGLDPAAHRFEAEDVGRFLARASADGLRYDLVLLDPPSFSAARNAPFAIERDYPDLIDRAASLLAPGGLLWLASNTRGVALLELLKAGLQRARRELVVLASGGLPADHPTLLAQPDDRYLQVVLVRPGVG